MDLPVPYKQITNPDAWQPRYQDKPLRPGRGGGKGPRRDFGRSIFDRWRKRSYPPPAAAQYAALPTLGISTQAESIATRDTLAIEAAIGRVEQLHHDLLPTWGWVGN